MSERDLKAGLELCNKATPGPWKEQGTSVQEWCIVSESTGDTVVGADYRDGPWVRITAEDADFVIEAREGWPHAIERAIKAEELARELVETLEIFDTVNVDASMKERIEDAKKARAVLVKAKEVLGDGD